ncbi:MAG: hypothetical protein R3B47_10040 [Bacteroidia bacterium]
MDLRQRHCCRRALRRAACYALFPLKDRKVEVELGFSQLVGQRHNAASTVMCRLFSPKICSIECDACVDVCPTDCITFIKMERRRSCKSGRLSAPATNMHQALYVSEELKQNG